MKPPDSEQLFTPEEDDPPNVESRMPLRPPPLPSDLAETEPPPPPTSKTDPTPPSAQPDRTDEILAAIAGLGASIESVRRDGVERDKALLQRILDSNAVIRDELNTKLDGQALHFKNEITAVGVLIDGGFKSLDEAVRDLGERFLPGVERAIDASGMRGEVRTLAETVATHTHILGEIVRVTGEHSALLKQIKEISQGTYNLTQAQGAKPDVAAYDAAERPTHAGDR